MLLLEVAWLPAVVAAVAAAAAAAVPFGRMASMTLVQVLRERDFMLEDVLDAYKLKKKYTGLLLQFPTWAMLLQRLPSG